MSIDPSGRGKDETGYAVVKMLNGFLFVTRAGGLQGGYDTPTLTKLAKIAKEEGVNQVIIDVVGSTDSECRLDLIACGVAVGDCHSVPILVY
jgi:hypothetical protein